MSEVHTTVLINATDGQDDLAECLEALAKYSSDCEVLVLFEAKTVRATVDGLPDIPDRVVSDLPARSSLAARINDGLVESIGPEVVLLSRHVRVTSGWLEALQAALFSDAMVAGVAPLIERTGGLAAAYERTDLEMQCDAFNHHDPDRWSRTLDLGIECVLLKREVFEALGGTDTDFESSYLFATDLWIRLVSAGHSLLRCENVVVTSSAPAGYGNYPQLACSQEVLALENEAFTSKWGFDMSYSTFVRREVLEYIEIASDQDQPRVLEIGCACGASLLELSNRYPKVEVFGVEINDKAAAVASAFADVRSMDVEQGLEYESSFFDYIILADVLEHLRDPWTTLTRLRRHLKPDGIVIASIPNVMHVSVLRNVISGFWTYEDSGILDRTHLRFFTLHEIDKLFAGAGFAARTYGATHVPLSEDDMRWIGGLEILAGGHVKEQYKVYQYLVKASR